MSETTTAPVSAPTFPEGVKVFVFTHPSEAFYWIAAETPEGAALHYAAVIAEGGTCLPRDVLQACIDLERDWDALKDFYHEVGPDERIYDPDEKIGEDAEGNPIYASETVAEVVTKETSFPCLIAVCGAD